MQILGWLTVLFFLALIILAGLIVKRAISWIQFFRRVEEYPKRGYPQIKVPAIKDIQEHPNRYAQLFKSYWGQVWYLDKETNYVYFYHRYYNEIKPYGNLRTKNEQ